MRLAIERGLDNVLVEDIAAAANVSTRTFNNYFASKYEAISALMLDRSYRIGEELRARPPGESLWEAITDAVLGVYAVTSIPPDPEVIAGIRLVTSSPALRGEYLKALAIAQYELAEAIAARSGGPAAGTYFTRGLAGAVTVGPAGGHGALAVRRPAGPDRPGGRGPRCASWPRAWRPCCPRRPAAAFARRKWRAPARPAASVAAPRRPRRAPVRRAPDPPPNPRPPPRLQQKDTPLLIRLLRAYLRPYRAAILRLVVLLQLVQTLATLYLPTLNADIIDNGVVNGDTGYILRTGGIMLGVTLVQIVCAIGAVYFGARTAMALGRDVRRGGVRPGAGRSPPARSASSAPRR